MDSEMDQQRERGDWRLVYENFAQLYFAKKNKK